MAAIVVRAGAGDSGRGSFGDGRCVTLTIVPQHEDFHMLLHGGGRALEECGRRAVAALAQGGGGGGGGLRGGRGGARVPRGGIAILKAYLISFCGG